MSVCTNLKIKGHVTPEEIVEYLKKYDRNTRYCGDQPSGNEEKSKVLYLRVGYGSNTLYQTQSGYIETSFKDESISIFYIYFNGNSYENLDYYREQGLTDMVKAETTHLSIALWGNALEMMKEIAEEFGGWLDESDCDGVPPYWIEGRRTPQMSKITYLRDVSPSNDRLASMATGAIIRLGELHSGDELYNALKEILGMEDDEIFFYYPELKDKRV